MSELAIRLGGTSRFIHHSPARNRTPASAKEGGNYLTEKIGEARRFGSLSSAESYARRLKMPFKNNGMKDAVFEIVEISYVISGVKLHV